MHLLHSTNQLISVHKYPFNFFFFKLSSKTNFLLQILYPFTPNNSMFVIDCYFPRHIMIQTLPSTCFNSLFEEISEKLASSKIFEILMIFEILTDCHWAALWLWRNCDWLTGWLSWVVSRDGSASENQRLLESRDVWGGAFSSRVGDDSRAGLGRDGMKQTWNKREK